MKEVEEGKRMALIEKNGTVEDAVNALIIRHELFAKYLGSAKWQAQHFQALTRDVLYEWLVYCLNFGEN